MSNIIIRGAKEGNLKNISLEIPRDKIIVVEHNQQVIRASDWIIDLGPEGGKRFCLE